MADDFDDELYNVYNTAKDDAYGNTDIYADYKDALSGDEPQDGSHMDMQGSDPQGQADTAASNMGMMDSSDHNVSGQGAGMQAGSAADDEGGDASGDNNPQQQMLKALQQQQQQQAMMNNWGQFQPNPYQFAMYQQALQQMMMNPYQLQQMMQRQFRQQQPSPTQQPQQQQQQQQQQNVDEGPPSVASAANQDEGKMFIGGLNWETTDESLKEYFSQFGEVMDCVVMRDPATGRSRGFGFLTMADPATIDKIVNEDHYLDGKRIDPKRAIPREEQDKTEKIFVGGISPDVDEEEFREFFTQFGKVMDATLMTDRETGRPRGFGFITFEDSKGVEEALLEPNLAIKGKTIEVKKAMPKSKQMRQNMMNNPLAAAGSRGYVPNTRYAGAAAFPGGRPGYGFGPTNMYGAAAMYGGYGGNYGMTPSAFYGRNTGGFGMGGSGNGSSSGSHHHGDEDSDYRDDMDHHDRRDYGDDNRRGGGDDRRSDSRRDDRRSDERRSDDRRYDDRRSRGDDRRSRHESSRHHDSSRYDSRHESRDRDRSSSRAERSPRSSSSGGGAIHASQSARNQHQYRPY